MPKKLHTRRPRPLAPNPPPPPPLGGRTPTPSPQSGSEPDPELFDPNRTPPPPADNIFHEDIPEAKAFEIPPLRSVPPQLRPLTGRPPAPLFSRGVKQRKGSGSRRATRSRRGAAAPPKTDTDPLEIIQTSLLQIQSYLNTLAAVKAQNNMPLPRTQGPQENPPPRASFVPPPAPATLADMLSVPHRGNKRYAHLSRPQNRPKISSISQDKHSSAIGGDTSQTALCVDSQFRMSNTHSLTMDIVA